MATIISTELKVYAGTTTSGSQIGNTITDSTSGGPSSVNLNSTSLGVALSAGEQYCVIARCTNDESYTTDWTSPYAFKTLAYAEIVTISGGNGTISPELSFTYNNQVLTVTECGVYVSTNASGSNSQKIAASDEQEAGQGWLITGLSENTTYYVIPYVIDDLGREYKGDWANAETCGTGYNPPVVTISNTATTYNSISGNLNVTTNDTLSSVYIDLQATGGGTHYRINKSATTGNQNFTITNGDTDANSQTIVINPSTEYRIVVYAVNTHGGTGTGQAVVTTAAQSTATIAITSITGITPFAATVNLSYGGGAVVNPTPGE